MIDPNELIARSREARFLEYKEGQPWDVLRAQIVKTSLGMANIRDGGYIVVGMSESGGRFEPTGLTPSMFATFSADTVSAQVNRYAEPFVDVDTYEHVTPDGKVFIVVEVQEFDDVPIMCRRDGDRLRRGAMYTRSRRMNETTEVQTSTDMREILDLATEKRLARLTGMLARGGIDLNETLQRSAEAMLDEELRGL